MSQFCTHWKLRQSFKEAIEAKFRNIFQALLLPNFFCGTSLNGDTYLAALLTRNYHCRIFPLSFDRNLVIIWNYWRIYQSLSVFPTAIVAVI